MNTYKSLLTLAAILATAGTAATAAEQQPTITTVPALYGGALNNMSANGAWAVGDAVNAENSSYRAFPRIVNAATGESTELFTESEATLNTAMSATCVSNDGKTAAGSYNGLPAVWKEGTGWKTLPLPGRTYNGGTVSGMTPDGKLAVGRVSIDLFREYPCLWDLESMTLTDLPGMIESNPRYKDIISAGGDPKDWTDADLNVRLTGISADGNTLLGMVDFCYPASAWEFVYDRSTATWTPLGMEYSDGRLKALDPDIYNVDECVFSADGKYIGGTYYSVRDASVPFLTTTATPADFTTYSDGEGYGVWAVGCDGTVYGSTPIGTPVRNWSAKVGKYWYDWKSAISQLYGIDWMTDITKDDMGLSGSVMAVSEDNKRILAVDAAQKISYILTLPEPFAELCANVDLLADYSVSPQNGAEFSTLQTIALTMDRDVEVLADKTAAYLADSDGNKLRASINLAVKAGSSKTIEIIFRNFTLEPEKDYKVVVPAGSICIAGDKERTNKEIRISYRGREAGPVKPTTISPENGSNVPRINLTTNPVTVTFNANIAPGETPAIALYQSKDGNEEYLFTLNAAINGKQMMLYPVSEQRLADGCDYKITVGAGTVTDLSGSGPNEEFSIVYHGSYVPEIDPSSSTIYKNDFSEGVAGMMLYDGDGNTPSTEMRKLGFDANNTPWMPVKDEDDTTGNWSAASHSSYEPAGKSDDWMVTPQLFVPDDKATLTFKSQSYRNGKNDMLKVYVWESDDVMTFLTANAADKIRYNGDLVYYQAQKPGKSEDDLAGDWTENKVDLSGYAGKYIYIAFVNDNQNQSAVFIDDVLVSRNVSALLSIDTETTTAGADDTAITGRIMVMKEGGIDGFRLELSGADGTVISTVSDDSHIEAGTTRKFEFPERVALDKGAVSSYQVSLITGDETIKTSLDIRNLLFKPTKRTVIEEMTGTTCQFCPQGIIATEHLLDLYGDAVIPVAIHSYTGDTFGGAEHNAYSEFLGLSAAPTASVGRSESVSPMWFSGTDYLFTAPDGLTWLQKTEESLSALPIADLTIDHVTADKETNQVTVDLTADFALDLTDANINIFGVLMEDNLLGFQTNGLLNTEAPGLGEWGKGGIYAKSRVMWYYDDVVRGTSAVNTAGVYSGFNGKGGYIPATVKAGEPCKATFDFTLPSGIKETGNTKVCVMLIDANTGEFINAAVRGCDASGVETPGSDADSRADVYDLTGRTVMRGATLSDLQTLEHGIYVRAGKKHIIR